jgi:hypothetical protein
LVVHAIVAGLLSVAVAVAQTPGGGTTSGPVGLILPVPGSPLSADQIEERIQTTSEGISTTEIVKSKTFRDSAGRMRFESSIPGPRGESIPIVSLVDPVAHFAAILRVADSIAYRLTQPASGGFAFSGMGRGLPAGKWQAKTEELGKRVIDGLEVEGTRRTRTSEDDPSVIAVDERWSSMTLGLTLQAESSGPGWTHTAKLQNIDRQDPAPSLFAIPAGFTIQDMAPGLDQR